jgi:exodeoxyribonuclease-3
MRFSRRWTASADLQAADRLLVFCGDLNVARTDLDVHPKDASRARSASCRRSARCSSIIGRGSWTSARHGSGQRRPVHLVGAMAKPATAQHRLAPRLRARDRGLAERALVPVQKDVGTSDHAPVMATFG